MGCLHRDSSRESFLVVQEAKSIGNGVWKTVSKNSTKSEAAPQGSLPGCLLFRSYQELALRLPHPIPSQFRFQMQRAIHRSDSRIQGLRWLRENLTVHLLLFVH